MGDFLRQFERTGLTAFPTMLDQRHAGQDRVNEAFGAVYEFRSNVDVDIGPGFRLLGLWLDDGAITEDRQGQKLVLLSRSAQDLSPNNLAEPVMSMSRLLWSADRTIGGSRKSRSEDGLEPDCCSPDRYVRPVTKCDAVGGSSPDRAPWRSPSVTKCCLLIRMNRSAAKEKMDDASSTEARFAMRYLLFSRFDESQFGKSD